MQKENVVDVDVMGPNMMRKKVVMDYVYVVDDFEEILEELDVNIDWM